MEQYYQKSNLTINSTFRTPKAGTVKQAFNFDKAGIPGTSTHHSQMNKENNMAGISSKKAIESQGKIEQDQFVFSKASTLDRKSYNFDTYGVKPGQVALNTGVYASNKQSQVNKVVSQPMLMSHDLNVLAAAKARDHVMATQPIQFTKNPMKADGKYTEKPANYAQETKHNRIPTEEFISMNSRVDDKNSDANIGNIYLKLISNLTMGSPKMKETTPDTRAHTNIRKMPTRSSYDFAHKELLQSNALKNSGKNSRAINYPEETQKSSSVHPDDYRSAARKGFMSNEDVQDYSLTKASSVERMKQPESTKNRSSGVENQYASYFSRVDVAQQRSPGNGIVTQGSGSIIQGNVSTLGSPKYASEKGFKFNERPYPASHSQEKVKMSVESNITVGREASNHENRSSSGSKTMNQKLEEYSNTLKKLEERIAKSKNERREDKPKSSPPMINNFISDTKQKSAMNVVQSASPKAENRMAPYQRYEEYEPAARVAQPNDFGLQKPQQRDASERDRYKTASSSQLTKGNYDTLAQQPKYMNSMSEKEYLDYLQNKNIREAEKTRQDSSKSQAVQYTRIKNAESFAETSSSEPKQVTRARPESAKTKKSDPVPTGSKKEQPLVQKSLKDFITQVSAG